LSDTYYYGLVIYIFGAFICFCKISFWEKLPYVRIPIAVTTVFHPHRARFDEFLELINTLMLSTTHNIVQINKDTLSDIQTYLQNAKENIDFFSLNLNCSRKNYNSGIIILNMFLFRTLKQTHIYNN